jgi:acetyl-CoA carboxylase carboxyl transferase subunit beta
VFEKIIAAVTQAADQHLPLLLVYTDSISAQPQSDTFVPVQTLSINAAMNRLVREKLLYVSVLTYSNSHSYFPGFACTADIVIAESNMPGTARSGRRAGQSEAASAAQVLLQSGMVDTIIPRRELKHTLTNILNFFC